MMDKLLKNQVCRGKALAASSYTQGGTLVASSRLRWTLAKLVVVIVIVIEIEIGLKSRPLWSTFL